MLLALLAAYTFHVRVTDARTALLANPHFEELKLTKEQLERAAHDRVMLFDRTTGSHFTWLMMSWPEDKPAVEQTLNDGAPGTPDVGLTPKSEKTLSIRCLREECRIGKVTLKKGESTEVPFDSDVRVEIPANESSAH
ncbi:MAG TPA: hypothetical protein VI670_20500 [Thermoanaerobaculia bacterium]|jgi:hypothetical protein